MGGGDRKWTVPPRPLDGPSRCLDTKLLRDSLRVPSRGKHSSSASPAPPQPRDADRAPFCGAAGTRRVRAARTPQRVHVPLRGIRVAPWLEARSVPPCARQPPAPSLAKRAWKSFTRLEMTVAPICFFEGGRCPRARFHPFLYSPGRTCPAPPGRRLPRRSVHEGRARGSPRPAAPHGDRRCCVLVLGAAAGAEGLATRGHRREPAALGGRAAASCPAGPASLFLRGPT